jgi:hypothetical protein
MITLHDIQNTKKINSDSKQWAIANIDYINSDNPLLGSSIKVEKGESEGYYTAILYMQPATKVSTITLCSAAALFGCEKPCLIGSGMLGMTTGQSAATRRTIIFLLDSVRFYAMLRKEITAKHRKHGDQLAIRLNGTTDIDFTDFIASMPHIRFYDYTKVYARVIKNKLANYDLTFSGSAYSEKTIAMTARAVNAGHRVAIAFNTGERKGEFSMPTDLADFDTTDLRFTDDKVLGGLKCKGGNRQSRLDNMDNANFFFSPKTYANLKSLIATDGLMA